MHAIRLIEFLSCEAPRARKCSLQATPCLSACRGVVLPTERSEAAVSEMRERGASIIG